MKPRQSAALFVAVYALALVVLLTIPLGPTQHRKPGYLQGLPGSVKRLAADTIMNIALFVPLGVGFHRLVRPAWPHPRAMIAVAFVCCVLSLSMETIQYFLQTRYSAITDVATNTLGAAAGAWLDRRIA